MKKQLFTILFLLVTIFSFGQKNEITDKPLSKKNEISSNLLDMVIAGSLNFNYERLFKNNQSLLLSATFFDTYGYLDVGYIDKTNAMSFKAAYLIYFSSKKDHAGFYFYPELKVRTGTITTDVESYYDHNNVLVQRYDKYDVDGVSLGFGFGHKWLFYNKFSLSLFGEVSRALGNTDDITIIEPRFGVQLGYRF